METAAEGARAVSCASDMPTGCFVAPAVCPSDCGPTTACSSESERADTGLSISAYAARLVSDHVQTQLPLPAAELQALRASIDEVNTLGRALNDVAHALHRRERVHGPTNGELKHYSLPWCASETASGRW